MNMRRRRERWPLAGAFQYKELYFERRPPTSIQSSISLRLLGRRSFSNHRLDEKPTYCGNRKIFQCSLGYDGAINAPASRPATLAHPQAAWRPIVATCGGKHPLDLGLECNSFVRHRNDYHRHNIKVDFGAIKFTGLDLDPSDSNHDHDASFVILSGNRQFQQG